MSRRSIKLSDLQAHRSLFRLNYRQARAHASPVKAFKQAARNTRLNSIEQAGLSVGISLLLKS